jgi:hypothetical protein
LAASAHYFVTGFDYCRSVLNELREENSLE